jgi:hypothetical protein
MDIESEIKNANGYRPTCIDIAVDGEGKSFGEDGPIKSDFRHPISQSVRMDRELHCNDRRRRHGI